MTIHSLLTIDVATGGQPEAAVAAATANHVVRGGQYRATVAHDSGCPCLTGLPMGSCTCEVVRVTLRQVGG